MTGLYRTTENGHAKVSAMFLDDDDTAPLERRSLELLKTWITALAMVSCLVMFVSLNVPARAQSMQIVATEAADPLVPDPMTTASTPTATPVVARHASAIVSRQGTTETEKWTSMGLLALSFALMAIGSRALWHRGLKDLSRDIVRRRRF
ncbi:MAG: hypothetical protein ACOH2J_20245 [Allorhizobium sp.]